MAAMNMNQEQFKQLIREEKPVLVDFWAPWCSYCRKIGPAYEKIGEEYADSLAVGKINIDEEPRLAGAEGEPGVRSLDEDNRVLNEGDTVSMEKLMGQSLFLSVFLGNSRNPL